MLTIRPLERAEIPLIKTFAPPDWNTDLSVTFGRHYGKPYFFPLAAEWEGTLAGCANGILNGKTGWLGNIIVLPEQRGHGIGTALTQSLVEIFRKMACSSQLLVATSMGEPVYRKLGFEIVSQYIFLKAETPHPALDDSRIRPFIERDRAAMLDLDRQVTGEDRGPLLAQFLEGGWIHKTPAGRVDGFFLPDLGQGPVLAENDDAGLALLAAKLARGCQSIIVPEGNTASLKYLAEHGFIETGRAPRMALGRDSDWQPRYMYSRGAGYCG